MEPEFRSAADVPRRDAETASEFPARGIQSLEDAEHKVDQVGASMELKQRRQCKGKGKGRNVSSNAVILC